MEATLYLKENQIVALNSSRTPPESGTHLWSPLYTSGPRSMRLALICLGGFTTHTTRAKDSFLADAPNPTPKHFVARTTARRHIGLLSHTGGWQTLQENTAPVGTFKRVRGYALHIQ
jgi:hypothetical protein